MRRKRRRGETRNESKVVAGERATSFLRLLTKTDAKPRYRVSVVAVVVVADAVVAVAVAVDVVAGNSINFATRLRPEKHTLDNTHRKTS